MHSNFQKCISLHLLLKNWCSTFLIALFQDDDDDDDVSGSDLDEDSEEEEDGRKRRDWNSKRETKRGKFVFSIYSLPWKTFFFFFYLESPQAKW